jgi:hypothetical protein
LQGNNNKLKIYNIQLDYEGVEKRQLILMGKAEGMREVVGA